MRMLVDAAEDPGAFLSSLSGPLSEVRRDWFRVNRGTNERTIFTVKDEPGTSLLHGVTPPCAKGLLARPRRNRPQCAGDGTPGILNWGAEHAFEPITEPRSLVDVQIERMGYSIEQRATLARQATLYRASRQFLGSRWIARHQLAFAPG